MNIFILDTDPKTNASYHCDKHVVKMIIETAQMLCTAHWETGSEAPYRSTHKNHPCTKWTRENTTNYLWLCELGMELCYEYTSRYGRIHKTQQHLEWLKNNVPKLPTGQLTEFPQAMPEQYKSKDVVEAYRQYYMGEKRDIVKWKNNVPCWYN